MIKKYIMLAACTLGLSLSSCEDFLNYTPTAVVGEDEALANPENMVTAAYAMLGDCWYTYPFNPNRSLENDKKLFLMTAIRKTALYMLDS